MANRSSTARTTRKPVQKQPTMEVVKITPELAEQWLSKNTQNRPVRERYVAELGEAMKRGEWVTNGDAIRFDDAGVLIDGQHRLWAVFTSEVTIESVVIRGLANESKLTIDHGARRKLSDHLRMAGHPNSVTLAAIINMVWKLENGHARDAVRPTVAQAMALLEEQPDIVESVKMVGRYHSRFSGSSAAVGALYYEFAMRDSDAAEIFFEKLIEGVGLEKDSPIFVLRKSLEISPPSTVVLMAIFIKAWNAYLEGRAITTLVWRPVGKTAEPFPVIKPEL